MGGGGEGRAARSPGGGTAGGADRPTSPWHSRHTASPFHQGAREGGSEKLSRLPQGARLVDGMAETCTQPAVWLGPRSRHCPCGLTGNEGIVSSSHRSLGLSVGPPTRPEAVAGGSGGPAPELPPPRAQSMCCP